METVLRNTLDSLDQWIYCIVSKICRS